MEKFFKRTVMPIIGLFAPVPAWSESGERLKGTIITLAVGGIPLGWIIVAIALVVKYSG